MATIYYSSACTPGQPVKAGLGDQTVIFSFTWPANAVINDQLGCVWIPINARVTDWYFDHNIKFGDSGSVSLGDFTISSSSYMGSSDATAARQRSTQNSGTFAAAATTSLLNQYTSIATMTGYTNIPPDVSDIIRLTVVAVGINPAAPVVEGWVRYFIV